MRWCETRLSRVSTANNDASDDWGWEEVSTHGHGGSQASSRAEVTVEKSLDTKKGKKQEPKQKQVKNNEKGKASLGKGKTRCISNTNRPARLRFRRPRRA